MAFVSSASTTEPRKFAVGPLQVEIQTFTMVSSDTTGTVTAKKLSRIDDCIVMSAGSVCQTAAPTISGSSVTLTFADPAAACTGYVAQNISGYIFLLGR